MRLSPSQIATFEKDGFLLFPDLFETHEIAVLKAEIERLSKIEAECIVREGDEETPKILLQVHDPDSATASEAFRQLTCSPRVLGAARQILRDDALYLHHSKVNMKAAIQGSTWPWHQDFMSWKLDGIEHPDMVTVLIMLHDATPMNGCLYFIPGSHHLHRLDPHYDTSTAYEFWAADAHTMRNVMAQHPDPVAVTGRAGTVAIFHCNLLHASGHNLSAVDRWHAFLCFNTVANRPHEVENPRPEYVRSTNWEALPLGENRAITVTAGA